jgi:hypothetical protein
MREATHAPRVGAVREGAGAPRGGLRAACRRVCRLAATLGLLACAAVLTAAQPGGAAPKPVSDTPFRDWISGDWADPRLHRCGTVWIRIEVEGDSYTIYQMTFGNRVRGSGGDIVEITDGVALITSDYRNPSRQIRYVTRDAHVLESRDGTGGVTYVRCERTPHPAATHSD